MSRSAAAVKRTQKTGGPGVEVKRASPARPARLKAVERGTREVASPHGYVRLLGIKSSETAALIGHIRAGLPFAALEQFQRASGFPARDLMEWLQIPQRTFMRRKQQGRLAADESDRLVRFARLLAAAIELFEGDEAAARRWLQSSQRALGGATPLEMARTEVGAREVEQLIGRLEHGVFS